jgi:hypothetical protein
LTKALPRGIINTEIKKGIDTMTKHYLFEDLETGEEFIVGACDLDEAKAIAEENFEEPEFCYQLTEYEAESSGLDEY